MSFRNIHKQPPLPKATLDFLANKVFGTPEDVSFAWQKLNFGNLKPQDLTPEKIEQLQVEITVIARQKTAEVLDEHEKDKDAGYRY